MMEIDWSKLLIPTDSLLEMVIRGTVIYLALFIAMRMLPRRTMGGVGPSDILVIVLISEGVSQGLSGKYESITEGLVVAATLIFWAVFIDWLDYRFPRLHLSDGKQIPLVRDGKLIRRNMQGQNITEDEVMAQLRQHGLSSLQGVEAVYVEGDGQFSVILRGNTPLQPPAQRRQA
jgi:uncharacterized membrane protein YcaP (DUF421 family)